MYANRLYSDTLYANNFSFQTKVASRKALVTLGPAAGSKVYAKAITVTVSEAYRNTCITWHVTQRSTVSYYIDLYLVNRGDSTAQIDRFIARPKFGNNCQVFAVASGNTVDIYIQKIEAYDVIGIISCEYSDGYMSGVTITYGTDSTYVTSLPSGVIQASCPAYLGDSGLYGAVFN